MPKRKKCEIKITHIMADGKVLTDEQFNNYVVDLNDPFNRNRLREANANLDPNRTIKSFERIKRELAADRKRELERQQSLILKELAALE